MMKLLSRAEAANYLRQNGVPSPKKIQEILGGFDLGKPIYEQRLEEGDALFQFMRNDTSLSGNWFCLSGATKAGVAIIDGGPGRRLYRYEVVTPITALEGTAARMDVNWMWYGGGPGGATQLYIPSRLVGALTPKGPQ